MNPIDHVWERLFLAVLAMAQGEGSAKDRLIGACIGPFTVLRPEELASLPTSIREEFEAIRQRITRVEPTDDEGSIAASIHAMDAHEVRSLVERLVTLFDSVARHVGLASE
jgi:hypothetical protein